MATEKIEKTKNNPLPPEQESLQNRRILRNAAGLSLRMAAVTLAGLFTSRVVLRALGVEDYGLYGVVGGVVTLLGFLNASLSGATSRFLTFEAGKGEEGQPGPVFSSALALHGLLALGVLLLGEGVGLWMLRHVLSVPEGRDVAAFWVLQCSVAGAAVVFTQVPYTAALLAHERMYVFAGIEVLAVGLKLLFLVPLVLFHGDRLILYASLTLAVSVASALASRIYCVRHFSECRFHFIWRKELLRPLLAFSGWDIYGNLCGIASTQCLCFLINIWFGVACNAAVALAYVVSGAVQGFTSAVSQAFQPQTIKRYAAGLTGSMRDVMRGSLRFTLTALSLLALPLILEAPYVLRLWLGTVPEGAATFLRLLLVGNMLGVCLGVYNTAIHATGRIRLLSLRGGTLFLLIPLGAWAAFHMGAPAAGAFVVSIVGQVLLVGNSGMLLSRLIPGIRAARVMTAAVRAMVVAVIAAAPPVILMSYMNEGLPRLVTVTLTYALVLLSLSWSAVFTPSERTTIKTFLHTHLH